MTSAGMTSESETAARGARSPISLTLFLGASIATALAAAGLALLGARLFEHEIAPRVLILACVAGFAVSTAGWLVVLRGFRDDPGRIFAYFGAGLLTKLVLLLLVVAVVTGFEVASLDEFFIPFAVVFFLTGFAQLGITVKGATKLLNEARKGAPRRNPAAPGAAVDPEERG